MLLARPSPSAHLTASTTADAVEPAEIIEKISRVPKNRAKIDVFKIGRKFGVFTMKMAQKCYKQLIEIYKQLIEIYKPAYMSL